MTPAEQTAAVLECLNSAYQADPGAMHALMCSIAPANQALIDHPHVIIKSYVRSLPTVNMLGVINGVMTAAGLPRIAGKYSDTPNADDVYEFVGFVVAAPNCQPSGV